MQLGVEGREAVLAVEDTGCGIAAEDQHLVFERFYRADKSRTTASGGNGLGVAICKSLVDAQRGRIAFTSTVGRGTRLKCGCRWRYRKSAALSGNRRHTPKELHTVTVDDSRRDGAD